MPKPVKKIQDMIGELRSWLPNHDHRGEGNYPTLLFRILASLPGGDELEDIGYQPFNLGWHEADQLGRMLEAIETKDDVEALVRGLLAEEDPEYDNNDQDDDGGESGGPDYSKSTTGPNGNRLVNFKSWKDVIAYARTGKPLYYQAPMDHRPVKLDPKSAWPKGHENTYEARDKTIKIWPTGSTGRGKSRTADPFVANSGHLDRFWRPS